MHSVRDSYDSDSGSLFEVPSLEEPLKLDNREKPIERAAIPDGIEVSFKKASDLLQATEVARLRFELLSGARRSDEIIEKERKEDETRSKVKTDRSGKKREHENTVLDMAIESERFTSCSFATEAQNMRQNSITQRNWLVKDGAYSEAELTGQTLTHQTSLAMTKSLPAKLDEKPAKSRNRIKVERILEPHVNNSGEDRGKMMESDTSRNDQPCIGSSKEIDINPAFAGDFRNLIRSYSYADQPIVQMKTSKNIRAIDPKPQMEKKVPLIKGPSPKKSPTKRNVSPKKRKQLTVTEKAVEEFRPQEVPDSLSLLEYFPMTSTKIAEHADTATKAKTKQKTMKKTKKAEKRSSLLPPSDAIDSLDKQKFVFSTSSQLLIHSSSPVSELIKTSENRVSTAATTLKRDGSFIDLDSFLESNGCLGLKSTRSLWSAATRNEDGSLMISDFIDLSKTPVRQISNANIDFPTQGPTLDPPQPQAGAPDGISRGRAMAEPEATTQSTTQIQKSIPSLPRSLGEASTRQRPTSKSPVKKKRRTRNAETKPMKPEDGFKKVSFKDLKEELKAFGVKPPRSRIKTIELILEYRAKQAQDPDGNAVGAIAEEGEPVSINGETGNKPSEVDPSTTSGQVESKIVIKHKTSKVPVSSQPKGKLCAPTTDTEPDDQPPPSFQTPIESLESNQEAADEAETAALLLGIHLAITSQAPTHSIKNPSWKEKIAMYDTIVLEDLTTWLNTGGLDSVGVDKEVSPALVRDWCESKSVCFIWLSEGWRKKRS